jgi:DNA-damage-inducible protein J
MSQSVNVNFKLDADVKKSMEQVCSELGLSMSRQRKEYSF